MHSSILMVSDHSYVPIVEWEQVEKSYPKYPSVKEARISPMDRDCVMDLRPYANQAPVSVQEQASVARTYELFRNLGLRFLPVVNHHNQVVGTITRADLASDGLASTLLMKGKKHI
jgi:chloride channel 7